MKTQFFRFVLCSIIANLTCLNLTAASSPASGENGVQFCGVTEQQPDNRRYARTLAQSDVGEPYTVRLIYFRPNDRTPQKDIDAKMDRLMKDVQQSYAEVMENHGFGGKTFRLETDTTGKAVVHQIVGQFVDANYRNGSWSVWEELNEQFDPSINVYLVALDVSSERLDDFACGYAISNGSVGGQALISASGRCFNVAVAAHELGHAFGLAHDRLRNAKRRPSSYHSDWMVTSFCAAEWLDAHRYFNIDKAYPEKDELTTIQMQPSIASSPNSIRLRFQITNADRLHQAQVMLNGNVITCQKLNGQSDMYDFELIPKLHGKPNDVVLRVIDVHGNFIEQSYPIDIAALLPPPEVVSIPDANLATAIREILNLAPGDTFTQWNLTELINLDAAGRQITDLTGLEHATQLEELTLGGNGISNISALAGLEILGSLTLFGNQIIDVSALAEMKNLGWLNLLGNQISDISALAGLAQLSGLDLTSNQISDITPLAGLTNLIFLSLANNRISNIAVVTGLTKLTELDLWGNNISDISMVAGLTKLTKLNLTDNKISDISPLVGNTGLGRSGMVEVGGNPLNYQSIYTHIPALREREVEVTFDNRTPQRIRIISGDNQESLPSAALANPFVVEVQDERRVAFEGVPVTFTVTSGDGTLSTTSTATNTNGRAESILTLGPNPGTNTVTVSAAGIPEGQTFNAVDILVPKTLEIISGNDQEGLPGAALDKPFVVEVRDRADTPVPGVQVTFSVARGGGTLSVPSATTDKNGRAESILTLGPNPGTNTVTVSVTGITRTEMFNAEGIRIPKTLKIVSEGDQVGLPGEVLEKPLVAEVRDQTDKPLLGVEVTFSVTGGDGTLSVTSATTDVNGRAETTLTLGPNPGTNTVEVAATGIQEKQTFNAEGIRIPETLDIVSGNDQEGLPGAALENSFVVEVRDRADTPVPGVQVTFSVTSGDGTLSATSATTDSNGRAESTLTLGPNPGTNTVTVSVAGTQEQQTFNAEGIRIPLAFWIISGDKQQGLLGEALAKPFVVEVRDQSGDPLPGVQVAFSVSIGGGMLSATSATTDSNGRSESILTLGPNPGANTVEVAAAGIQEKQSVSAIAELPPIPQDVNGDDVVNILDLVFVASALGDEGHGLVADVNGDGVVNILDLVMVAGALGNAAAAPSVWYRDLEIAPTRAEVGQWLAQTGELGLTDATSQRGVLFLEQLFAALTPKETALLPNYPNPFNPETWMPYQLAEDAFVTLTIYDGRGRAVRTLEIGHRISGFYEDRSQAIYWDGRNDFGEGVASGVYFYHLSAGDYSATRKMLIIK